MPSNTLLTGWLTLHVMAPTPINEVLAENLNHYMREMKLTQMAVASKAQISQRTVGNYLNPKLRADTNGGKAPSAKLTELEKIASVLQVEVWQLLRPVKASERELYKQIDESFRKLATLAGSPGPSKTRKSEKAES